MKILPGNWSLQPVGDICAEIVDCINKTAPTVDGPTPYKMIRTTNVRHGRVSTEEVRYVDEKTYQRWTRRSVPKRNDIVLTREAPLGEVGLIRTDENLFLGQRTMMYRADARTTDQNYLYYAFQGGIVQGQIRSWGSGATVEHLRVPDASKFQVPVPPIKVQRKIAAILTAYDELIENNRQRITRLEKLAKEIYREWFVRLRFPGHQSTTFRKGLPSEWSIKTIGELCSLVTDGAHASPPSVDAGKAMASVKDMTGQGFDLSGARTISEADFERLTQSNCRPEQGDVLIAKDGSYLKHVFVFSGGQEVVILSSIAILRPNLERVLPHFFAQVLRQDSTKAMMAGYVSGVAVPRIILKDFKKMKLLIPDMRLMRRYEDLVTDIHQQVETLIASSQNLSECRDLLLNRLISGKLRVDDLDIQFPPGMQADAA